MPFTFRITCAQIRFVSTVRQPYKIEADIDDVDIIEVPSTEWNVEIQKECEVTDFRLVLIKNGPLWDQRKVQPSDQVFKYDDTIPIGFPLSKMVKLDKATPLGNSKITVNPAVAKDYPDQLKKKNTFWL